MCSLAYANSQIRERPLMDVHCAHRQLTFRRDDRVTHLDQLAFRNHVCVEGSSIVLADSVLFSHLHNSSLYDEVYKVPAISE